MRYLCPVKLQINPKYACLEPFLRSLPEVFDDPRQGTVLHAGRNTIKAFVWDGVRIVAKRYGGITLLNRFVYGTLRQSKAQRAYAHAERLRRLGVETPEEVGTIEIRRRGLLCDSYFVSLESDGLPFSDLVARFPDEKVLPVVDSFARFLCRLHEKGVLHRDLNVTNVLYRCLPDGDCAFSLIDTNRMTFRRRLSPRACTINLRRLSCKVEAYLYIVHCYAEGAHADPGRSMLQSVLTRLLFERKQQFKQNLKQRIHAR